jgi:hypothetical protein
VEIKGTHAASPFKSGIRDWKGSKSLQTDVFRQYAYGLPAVSQSSGTTRLQIRSDSPEQRAPGHDKITQRAGDKQAMSIFVQATVPDLRESKLPFDNPELVFH